jgi:ferrous iron transport protein A
MTIMDLKAGESFTVLGVALNRETGKRLADMGFTLGVEGRLIRKALFGDPVQVTILGYHVSIRKTEAQGVSVERREPA